MQFSHRSRLSWGTQTTEIISLETIRLRPVHLRSHSLEICLFETKFTGDHVHLRPLHLMPVHLIVFIWTPKSLRCHPIICFMIGLFISDSWSVWLCFQT